MRRGQDNTEDRLPATVSGSFRETLDRAALGDPPKSPARVTVKSRKSVCPSSPCHEFKFVLEASNTDRSALVMGSA